VHDINQCMFVIFDVLIYFDLDMIEDMIVSVVFGFVLEVL
jgi:hypothetical protein